MIIQKTGIKPEKWESHSKSGLFLVFIFATIMLFAGGYLYLKNEETVWSKNALKQLKNTTLLKAKQIEEWRNERRSDAREIVQSPLFQDAVYNLINHQGKKGLKSEIEQRLQIVIQNNPDIVNILLTDDKGQTLLSGKTGEPDFAFASTCKLVREVIKRNNEIFGDLYKNSQDDAIYADIACPVFNERYEINAVILFRLNTGVSLFPILQVWPYDSTTEESFLFKKDGDSVLFMSNLRNWPNAALSLKFPLTSNENPAARAIKEGPGFYKGIGYHGQRVLEYIQPINGSPWLLASKIDRDELFKPVYKRAKTLSVILVLLFLSLSTLIYLIITYRRKHFYKKLLEDERQQAALKSHFEYVVKYANDIILLEDEKLNIIEANQRAQQTYQYSLGELSKMKITDLVAPESRQQVEIRLKNITENDGAIIESIHRRKDGTLFHVEISARIIKVDGRAFLHQVIRDITERKQAEIALTESEERFRTTLYSTGDAIITTDIYGKIRYMNPVAEELTGWKEDEAGGKPIREVFNIFDEDTRVEVENPVDKVLEKGMIVLLSNHTFLKSKNGREIPIGDSGAPIRNAEGQIAGVVLVFRDQTHEREVQRQIRESEEKYRKAFQTSPDAVNINRLDGLYVDINEGFTNLTGFTREEVIGKLSTEIDIWAIPEDREKLVAGIKEKDFVHNLESKFRCKDGSLKTCLMSANLIHLNNESHILSITRDITERKRAEEEIKHNEVRLRSIVEILQYDTSNIQHFLDFALEQAIKLTASQIGYIYHYNEEKKEFVLNSWSQNVMKECLVMEKQTVYKLDQTGIWGEAVRQRKPIMFNDFQASHLLKKGHPEGHIPLRKFLTLPVFVHDKIVGVVGVANKATDYNEVDVLQLSLLTDSVWKVINHKQAEEALRKSEENLSITLNSIGDAVISTDIDGLVVSMNPVAESLCGLQFAEAEGKQLTEIFKIINSETRETVADPVKKVLEKGDIVGLVNHTVLISKNKIEYQIADSAAPIKNKEGEISGVVLVFSDVTEKYVAQKQIRESESYLKETQNIAHLGTYSLDISTGIWTSSEILDEIFGIERSHDKSVQEWVSIIHPDWQKTMDDYFIQDVIGEKTKFDKEYQILRKIDNEVRWVHGLGNIEYDKQLKPIRMIGTILDITERKQAEAEQFRLLNIIEKSLNEIYVFDAITLKFEFANHGALENLGFSLEEMKELTPVDIKPEFTDETFRQVIEPLKTGLKDKLILETKHQRKNGSSYPVEIHLQIHKTDNKSVFLAVINDITERLENINALQQSKDRWESLFNNSPNAIAVYQAVDDGNDFVFTDFNLSAQKTDNLIHNEVIGKRISGLFPTADQLGLLNVFRKVWRTGKTEFLSSTFYKDDRIDGWRENIIYKLNTGEIVAIYNDVSDRIEAEIALRESEENFRNYFENSPLGKSITGVDGSLNVNKAFCQMLGYSKEELLYINWKEIIHPDDLQLSENVTKSLMDGEKEIVWIEKRFIHKNGNTIWTEVSSTLQKDAEDKPSYFITNINNITERKQAEKQLKLLGRAIDQNPVTIVITNTDGDIKYVNPKFTEVTGYTSGEVIGKNPRVLQSGEHNAEFYKNLWDTILSGADWHGEFHNKKKNGEHYWESAVISPVFDDNGEISSFVAVKEDITEKKKMIQDLIIAKEHAEESDRLKSSFLATMSHELRTPLNAVIGFSSLMDQEMPIEQIISFAQIINHSGKNLLEIIEGIFDLSILASGDARMNPEQFDLLAFMDKILDIAKAEQQNAGRQQIELIYAKTKHPEPVLLYSDQHKLTQVLTNLLKNALKFTLSGKIEFGYVNHPDNNNYKIKFFVKDTGIGIPDDRKSIVFDRFRQGDDSNTRLYGGAGIGLAISKHTVELLGGKIWVESEVGNGSTFFVLLPANIIKNEKTG